jgi:hypothetical protein
LTKKVHHGQRPRKEEEEQRAEAQHCREAEEKEGEGIDQITADAIRSGLGGMRSVVGMGDPLIGGRGRR